MSAEGIVKLRLTAVSDPQHGGFTAGSSPVSWGSVDELFVNLTVPLEGLLAATRQANVHTTRDRLRAAVPATAALFERLAERGEALRPHATRLLALLDDYGPQELAAAVDDALQRDALGAGSITHILETRRRQRGLKPPLRLTLPDRPGLRDLDVRSHNLETYDALGRHDHHDDAGD